MKHLNTFLNFEIITESKKYEHINFIPPQTVSKKVEKGLKYRTKSKYTIKPQPGVYNLKNRDKISPRMIKKMCAFFNRHKKGKTPSSTIDPWNDKKHVQWLLWGGDSGRIWSERIRTQIAKADKKKVNKYET